MSPRWKKAMGWLEAKMSRVYPERNSEMNRETMEAWGWAIHQGWVNPQEKAFPGGWGGRRVEE